MSGRTRQDGSGDSNRRRALCASVSAAAVFALLAPGRALAAEAAGGAVGEIVVTGTRLSSQSFQQPTPVQAVTGEALQNAAPTTLAEGLRRIPALQQTSDGAAQGQSSNGTGAITAPST